MDWKPWEEYADVNLVDLPIEEPPCKHCKYWKPQRVLQNKSGVGQVCGGVQCCWAKEQVDDFSCYEPREAKDPRTSPPKEWPTSFDRSVEHWGTQESTFDRSQSPTFTGRIVYPGQAEEKTEEWPIGTELDFRLALESFNAKSHKLQIPKPATPTNPQTLETDGKFVDAAEWQPIETAPKDGTIILANHKDWDTPKVRHWKEAQVDGLFYWGIPYERDSELVYLDKEDLPTHWVPIPPFPTIEDS